MCGCTAGLTSQQWGQKKAAAKALADLAEAGGDALPPHTPTLISTILQVSRPSSLSCVHAEPDSSMTHKRLHHNMCADRSFVIMPIKSTQVLVGASDTTSQTPFATYLPKKGCTAIAAVVWYLKNMVPKQQIAKLLCERRYTQYVYWCSQHGSSHNLPLP